MHLWAEGQHDPRELESYFVAGGVLRAVAVRTPDGWPAARPMPMVHRARVGSDRESPAPVVESVAAVLCSRQSESPSPASAIPTGMAAIRRKACGSNGIRTVDSEAEQDESH